MKNLEENETVVFNGRKVSLEELVEVQVTSTKDVAELFMEDLRNEEKEVMKLLILNSENYVKRIVTLGNGTENNAKIAIKDIIDIVLKSEETKFVLVHNHPSGDSTPSKKDVESSILIHDTAKNFEIEMLDHVVIGNGNYSSALILNEEEEAHE